MVSPFFGLLTGGRYASAFRSPQGGGGDLGNVAAGDTYNTNYTHHTCYSRGPDADARLVISLVLSYLQVQLVYSYGRRNLGASYSKGQAAPSYHNRCVTPAAAYLLGGAK